MHPQAMADLMSVLLTNDDKECAFRRSPSRSSYRVHEVQSDFVSVDDVADVRYPGEAPVVEDAEKLHRLLELDPDVICLDVFASGKEDVNCLVNRRIFRLY